MLKVNGKFRVVNSVGDTCDPVDINGLLFSVCTRTCVVLLMSNIIRHEVKVKSIALLYPYC